MKKLTSTGLILGAFLFGMASCNQEQGAVEQAQEINEQRAEDTPREDRMTDMSEFMTQAASVNMLEIQAGQLAQQRAQRQEVKDYAQMIVNDHQNATQQLQQLAQQKNIVLPDSMGQDHRDQMQDLRDQTGQEFDQEYMDLMVSSHENAVDMFENASNNMEDQDVRSFASSTLPTLRQHLDRAREVQNTLNNNQ